MRLIFCFSRSCFAYSDALRRRAVAWPCWPGRVRTTLDRALLGEALRALQEQLGAFATALTAARSRVRPIAQTLRRLGGRQPLCGIGVTSLIDLTCSPAAASAWMADSRPLPGPCTRTCTRLHTEPSAPRARTARPRRSPRTACDFFEPLKPALPDEPHAIVLPCVSVIVTVVLLNVALTCATPSASTTRFVFLVPCAP